MSKFIYKVLLLSITISIALVLTEYFVRKVPNEYSYKKEYLDTNISDIEILSLRSSIGRSGINPKYFSYRTFNAGNVSQDLRRDWDLVNCYLDKASQLKYLILPLFSMSYWYELENSIESWRLRKYAIYMNMHSGLSVVDNLEVSSPVVCRDILKRYYISKRSLVECDSLGCGLDSINELDFKKSALLASQLHNCSMDSLTEEDNLILLDSIIKKAFIKDVKVILLLTPCDSTYRKRMNEKQIKRFDFLSNKLVRENKNVFYIDMFADNRFMHDDFRNANHLSIEGGKKLSQIINDTILTTLDKINIERND